MTCACTGMHVLLLTIGVLTSAGAIPSRLYWASSSLVAWIINAVIWRRWFRQLPHDLVVLMWHNTYRCTHGCVISWWRFCRFVVVQDGTARKNERTSERTNEGTTEKRKERTNKRRKERMTEARNEGGNEGPNQGTNERRNQGTTGQREERMNEHGKEARKEGRNGMVSGGAGWFGMVWCGMGWFCVGCFGVL